MPILHYNDDNILFLEKFNLLKLCSSIPTPFYIYSANDIVNNCQKISGKFDKQKFLPCYALKANYNPSILKIIKQQGFGADVVSGGELYFALKAGFPADKIVFAGVGKTEEEISFAIKSDIHSLIIESEQELDLVDKISTRLKKSTAVAIRVNPDIDPQTHPYISTGLKYNKFGVDKDTAFKMFKKTRGLKYITETGLHVHIGSQITSDKPYIETGNFLYNFVQLLKKYGINISFLDLGGGIGINYENQLDQDGNIRNYIDRILPEYVRAVSDLKIKTIVELGRSVVGSAGLLITKILYVKKTPDKTFLIVDAAMNNLIRPSLYQAHHQVLELQLQNNPVQKYDIVGPVCESTDYFAKDRNLHQPAAGQYIALTAAGAYGQVLASNYNVRPRVTEILVDGSNYDIIYKGETINQIADNYKWDQQ